MKTIKFYGHSDDCFEVEGPGFQMEAGCYSRALYAIVEAGEAGKREALVVRGEYAPGPCTGWVFGVAPEGDDTGIPNWPIRLEREPGPWPGDRSYTPYLVIEAPDDVRVRVVDEDGEDVEA